MLRGCGRTTRLGAMSGLVAVVLAVLAPAPGAAGSPAVAEKVLVMSLPSLAWPTVVQERPRNLVELLEQGALASLSVRTIGPSTSRGEAYATLGAGNRATAGPAPPPAVMVDRQSGVPGDVAVLEAACGCPLTGWRIFQPGAAAMAAANDKELYGARPGALGAALAAAGKVTAVVANADVAEPGGGVEVHREAVLAVMDEQGRVDGGSVGGELLIADPGAPGGVVTDVESTARAFRQAWATADVVLVEAGDLARTPRGDHAGGLERTDRLLGAVLADVDLGRHLVVVVAPTSGQPGGDGLTVAAVVGPGIRPGLATSASTRQAGYVTLPDVAPTVLGALGLPVPEHMTGAGVGRADGPGLPGEAGMEALARVDEVVAFRDRAVGPVSVAFVAVQVVAYGLAVAAAWRWGRLRPWARFLALVTLALPSLAFLSALVPYHSLGLPGYVAALFAGAAVLAAGASGLVAVVPSPAGSSRALLTSLVLVGLTFVVLVVDVLTGGRLQMNTVFGHSPTVAGRFSGFGNLAFSLVAVGAVVLATGAWAVASLRRPVAPPAPRGRLLAVAAVLALAVVADGHPSFGADVGGVLALVPAAIVVVVLLGGWRLTARLGAVIALSTVGALAAFVAVDLARPADARTHLGRTAAAVLGDGTALAMIVERKARANVAILSSSPWVLVIPVVLVGCAVLLARPPEGLRRLEAGVPGLRACLVGALVLGVAGGAFNDSGAAVPAMMMAVVLPYVTVLALADR